jgi:hypothetical protein
MDHQHMAVLVAQDTAVFYPVKGAFAKSKFLPEV